MSVNKVEVQKMIDKLEQYPFPIDMTSFRSCAACIIAEVSRYSDAIDHIENRTEINRSTLNDIFCNITVAKHAEENEEATWVYPVNNAKYVTKEMVIKQLQKFL